MSERHVKVIQAEKMLGADVYWPSDAMTLRPMVVDERPVDETGVTTVANTMDSRRSESTAPADESLCTSNVLDLSDALEENGASEPEQLMPSASDLISPYVEADGNLFLRRQTRSGPPFKLLSNFCARIVGEQIEYDGEESVRRYQIWVNYKGAVSVYSATPQQFTAMSWSAKDLPPGAAISVGAKDHVRAAIQQLSGEVPVSRTYTQTGWMNLESGIYVYVHAGGGIERPQTDAGPVTETQPAVVQTKIPEDMDLFRLSAPPRPGEDLKASIRASLGLTELIPFDVGIPLLAGIYRAALGPCDFSLHLVGPSGTFKSEMAALAQQHFGAGFDARHLPGAWSSTGSALQFVTHRYKDALCVIDDFAPNGTGGTVKELHSKADAVFRGVGNGAGRQRLNPGGTLQPERRPRCLVLSTGEDIMNGHSVRGRLLALRIKPGMIDSSKLTECQKLAREGIYAQAMAGFVDYIAPRYEQVQTEKQEQVIQLRDAHLASLAAETASSNHQQGQQHSRTAEIIANLGCGMRFYLDYALDADAITVEERESLWQSSWAALRQAAAAQTEYHVSSEPARQFLDLLKNGLLSGRIYLADARGKVPPQPAACGWRHDHGSLIWRPQGDKIGWIHGDSVYLLPDAAWKAARRLSCGSGDNIALNDQTLHKRLHEQGFLVTIEKKRDTLTVRKTLEGVRQNVLHLSKGIFIDDDLEDDDLEDDQLELEDVDLGDLD